VRTKGLVLVAGVAAAGAVDEADADDDPVVMAPAKHKDDASSYRYLLWMQ
jgi:hypothetical protein